MSLKRGLVERSVNRHYTVIALTVAVTVAMAVLAAAPSVWSPAGKFLNEVKVDADPENMLSADEPVRVFHNRMKKEFSLYDMVVVGVVNDVHPDGVFNPRSLARIHRLTEFAKTLRWEVDGRTVGVVEGDIIAPSLVDSMEPGGPGEVKFEWLMRTPPETESAALEVRRKAMRVPFLKGTLVSDDGRAVAIYLPLTSKDLSHRVYTALNEKIPEIWEESAGAGGAPYGSDPDRVYITGLPVAEDTFGVEMFIQMAISAPTAMLVIFILMIVFFRKLVVIISPLILALVSVIITMGALVIAGFPIHVMSSMIPIFIMPIAVLDSVHIISEFFEEYQRSKSARATILSVMDSLFTPMLYTSLTSAAGFASLALTPIPPVQVFGLFVAVGIMVAWFLTVTFIPAFVMAIPPSMLENFGARHGADEGRQRGTSRVMASFLQHMGSFTFRRAKVIIALALVVIFIAGYGISKIRVNDNPIKWFKQSHPMRVADRVLNAHFGGTYMAYLAMRAPEGAFDAEEAAARLTRAAGEGAREAKGYFSDEAPVDEVFAAVAEEAKAAAGAGSADAFYDAVAEALSAKAEGAGGEAAFVWDEAVSLLELERQAAGELFKDPAILRYQSEIQRVMLDTGIVGKSNSLSDIVKTVHRELLASPGEDASQYFRIPDKRRMVAETLLQFQNSHRPRDLWHFVTPDYRTSSIWVQLKSGDNRDMSRVKAAVDAYLANYPPPVPMKFDWFGLTYINVVWQEKMVIGMLQALAGSFLVVFLLMAILYRSALWGLLSMVPLTVTIAAIYGATGIIGKDYDMPVAVLSSLTLGLAIDFAIHFLARSRAMYAEHGSWERTSPHVFAEPARAITRNIIVIAAGFLPLLLAPLVPYKTVGFLLVTILLVSGLSTLLLLGALVRVLEKRLFVAKAAMGPTCNCVLCIASSTALVLLIALILRQHVGLPWTTLTYVSLIAVPVLALLCGIISRRAKCSVGAEEETEGAGGDEGPPQGDREPEGGRT